MTEVFIKKEDCLCKTNALNKTKIKVTKSKKSPLIFFSTQFTSYKLLLCRLT